MDAICVGDDLLMFIFHSQLNELWLSLDHISSVLSALLRSYIHVAFNDSSPSSLIYLPFLIYRAGIGKNFMLSSFLLTLQKYVNILTLHPA